MKNRIYVILLISLVTLGCSEQKKETSSCNGLIDSVKIIDKKTNDKKTYHLVHRVRGLQDKTEIIEIYDHSPTFDFCGNSQIEPIAENSIDSRDFHNKPQFIKEVVFNTSKNSMIFYYVSKKPNNSDDKKVSLILK
ncbi:hypothetical protein [Aliikangiella sp. IMCC44359]|uniref:hypothetical protein n=1 Tax=Aliikangiella sp. IMCC44359 TaxID=3459125 RepID=UPI00403ACD0A